MEETPYPAWYMVDDEREGKGNAAVAYGTGSWLCSWWLHIHFSPFSTSPKQLDKISNHERPMWEQSDYCNDVEPLTPRPQTEDAPLLHDVTPPVKKRLETLMVGRGSAVEPGEPSPQSVLTIGELPPSKPDLPASYFDAGSPTSSTKRRSRDIIYALNHDDIALHDMTYHGLCGNYVSNRATSCLSLLQCISKSIHPGVSGSRSGSFSQW